MIFKDQDLQRYNTFGIAVKARYYAPFSSAEGLREILNNKPDGVENLMVLGGGSNVLFTQDYSGLIVANEIKGVSCEKEDDSHVWVSCGSGEKWHDVVVHCVDKGWAGIENLSLIPGKIGAAPMQNIGAYGVELKDVFERLEAVHLPTGELHNFSASDCEFAYRESVFKRKLSGQYCITKVVLKLKKTPIFNTEYGAIRQELDKMGISELTLKNVSQAIVNIRKRKLPDPNQMGNGGSFFKNPIVQKSVAETLKEKFENIPIYPVESDKVKLAAGWLIEQAGWKGYHRGQIGVHVNQALVLVNLGGGTGEEIYALSQEILEDVESKFGVRLEREVNVV